MEINENSFDFSGSPCRAAHPAPAREVVKSNCRQASGDPAVAPRTEDREARMAEIRRQVEDGTYQVNADEVSAAIIAKHLKP